MVWSTEPNRIPTSIGTIALALFDHDGVPANHTITFNVAVLDQNEEVLAARTGDLELHLTAAQKIVLVDFMAEMRTKAETELLSGG